MKFEFFPVFKTLELSINSLSCLYLLHPLEPILTVSSSETFKGQGSEGVVVYVVSQPLNQIFVRGKHCTLLVCNLVFPSFLLLVEVRSEVLSFYIAFSVLEVIVKSRGDSWIKVVVGGGRRDKSVDHSGIGRMSVALGVGSVEGREWREFHTLWIFFNLLVTTMLFYRVN